MEFLETWALRGPNFWSRRTVLEAWVDIGDLRDSPSNTIPGLYDRLVAWLPGLVEHRCGVGERGGFLMRLRDGTYAAHILEHVTIELQTLAGTPVGFGKARETSRPGLYKVAVRFREEAVGRACLLEARELVLAAVWDRPYDLAAAVARLKDLAYDACLGPSTMAIVDAAEARGIPAHRLSDKSLVQLGQGSLARRIWTAETDRTSAVAEAIAQDKQLTKRLLSECGVPVPEGRAASSPADAWAAAEEIGLPVVVKPRDGNHGRAVFLELTTREQVERAWAVAREEGSGVLVERFVPGSEHRLLVVGDRMVAAARGETAWVVGDGRSTVAALVEAQLNSDPNRGFGDDCALNPVEIDPVATLDLERQGYQPSSVPADGVRVLVQRNGNAVFDVTDDVHPDVAAHAVQAARVVGLDVAGVDVVAVDVSRPLEEQGGAVVEVNAGPALHAHLMPAAGKPRPVGPAIVDRLFPPGETGRVPVACVTGTNGKTIVARLVASMLRASGRCVGLACSDGLFVDRRRVEAGDRADLASARKILLNPAVEAAVLEAGARTILREGLGFDRCQVAVVTGIGEADHLGEHFIDTPEQMVQVKRCPVDVVLPTGTAVLKADDPLVADMASLCAGTVTFFAADPGHPVLVAHAGRGDRVVTVRGGRIVLCEGASETDVVEAALVPATRGGTVAFQVDNALAATAAGWALGVAADTLRSVLLSFGDGDFDAPGRFDVFEARGATVVVDRAGNPSAVTSLVQALEPFRAPHRTIVWSIGARGEGDAARLGERLASTFDVVIRCDAPDCARVVEEALGRTGPGDVLALLVGADEAGLALDRVRAWAGG